MEIINIVIIWITIAIVFSIITENITKKENKEKTLEQQNINNNDNIQSAAKETNTQKELEYKNEIEDEDKEELNDEIPIELEYELNETDLNLESSLTNTDVDKVIPEEVIYSTTYNEEPWYEHAKVKNIITDNLEEILKPKKRKFKIKEKYF